MDDEDYARQLHAILAAPPDPEVPPGHLGDDWIDRSDGFGTDVRVTAIAVVPGDHGNQLDITFVGQAGGADEATCSAYFHNPMPMDDGKGGEKVVEFGGIYHHTLTRTPDGWRSRKLHEEIVWKRGL